LIGGNADVGLNECGHSLVQFRVALIARLGGFPSGGQELPLMHALKARLFFKVGHAPF
jgi:hypothetical protein